MEIIYITFTSARFRGSPCINARRARATAFPDLAEPRARLVNGSPAQPAAQVIRIRGSPRGSLRVTRGSKALVRKGIYIYLY